MDPKAVLEQIRTWLREGRLSADELDDYVASISNGSFTNYGDFVYFAQQGVRREDDPDQAAARVSRMSGPQRFLRSMVGGIPFSDEILNLIGNPTFDPELGIQNPTGRPGDELQADEDYFRENYRVPSFLGEMAGGMALPVGVGTAVARKGAAAGTGPLVNALKGGAAAGAVEGGVFGLEEGDTAGERLVGGALGVPVGAVAGAVTGGAGRGLSFTGRRLAEMMGRSSEGTSRVQAGRRLQRFLNDAGVPLDEVDMRMQALGPDAVVADVSPVAGGNEIYAARSVAGGSLDRPGGPAQRLAGRAGDRSERMTADLAQVAESRGFPVGDRVDNMVAEIQNQAQRDAYGPLDEQFGEFTLGQMPTLRQLLDTDGFAADTFVKVIGDIKRPLRFSDVQRYRNALRLRLRRLRGDPTSPLGEQESLERLLEATTYAMRQDFGDAVAQGDALWSQSMRLLDSYENGLKLGNQSGQRTVRSLRNDYGQMPPQERAALIAGAVDQIMGQMAETTTGGSITSKIVNTSPAMEQRLRALLGDEGFDALENAIHREQAYYTTQYYGGLNSLSGGRIENIRSMREAPERPPVNKWEVFRQLGGWFTNNEEMIRGKANLIGEALMAGDTELLRDLLKGSTRQGSGITEAQLSSLLASPMNRFIMLEMLGRGNGS